MLKRYKLLMTLFLIMLSIMLQGQSIIINLPASPSPNVSDWATSSSPFLINITGTTGLGESRMLVFIKTSSGQIVCGTNQPSMAIPTDIKPEAPRVWAGQSAVALLGDDCTLSSGSYELCVQLFSIKNREGAMADVERCVPFEIRDVECSPPNNVTPSDEHTFTTTDILKPITFRWSPFVMQNQKMITYNLMVWEVEVGQTPYEALYNNLPVVDENVKNSTTYIARPGMIENRTSVYVWRVRAVDEEGNSLCDNAQSEPTIFNIEIPEKTSVIIDEDVKNPSTDDECCTNVVIDNGNTININSANVADIEQKFNITPSNIRRVSIEIVSVNEKRSGSCDECSDNESWIYKFISHNTTSWNNEPALNASPVNGSSYYPSNLIEWHCDKQGDVKFDLKIALPDKQSGCIRDITVCLRFKFTDEDCNVCEEIICYELKN